MSGSDDLAPALEVSDLSSSRGGVEVLHRVSFTLGNELVIVVGLNGSGKSTLLRTICGLTPATSGQVRAGGSLISKKRCHEVVKFGLAFMPQNAQLFNGLSVLENLRLGGYLLPKRDVQIEVDHQFERFAKLRSRAKVQARSLSGGERQMLALAKALMNRPRVLLLDEPSAGLAPSARASIFAVIRRLRDERIPMLLAEQNVQQATEVADRALVLYLGNCRESVNLGSGVEGHRVLREAMLGPENVVRGSGAAFA